MHVSVLTCLFVLRPGSDSPQIRSMCQLPATSHSQLTAPADVRRRAGARGLGDSRQHVYATDTHHKRCP